MICYGSEQMFRSIVYTIICMLTTSVNASNTLHHDRQSTEEKVIYYVEKLKKDSENISNYKEIIELLKELAKESNPEAQYGLGHFSIKGMV